jgi:hypothetical protein
MSGCVHADAALAKLSVARRASQTVCGKVENAELQVSLTALFGGHLLDRRRRHLILSDKCHGMDACAAADAESQERKKPSEPQ